MKNYEPKIIQFKGAEDSKTKIQPEQRFKNYAEREVFWKIFIAFPGVFQIIDIEFWGTYKLAFFAEMSF